MAGRPSAIGPSAPRPPSAYLAEGADHETKGIRYESAFMAIAPTSTPTAAPSATPPAVMPNPLSIVFDTGPLPTCGAADRA